MFTSLYGNSMILRLNSEHRAWFVEIKKAKKEDKNQDPTGLHPWYLHPNCPIQPVFEELTEQ